MTPPRFGPRAEEALRRTLKDIDDGHLTLWVRGRFFDEHTGARLDRPRSRCWPTGSRSPACRTRAAPGGCRCSSVAG
jgi:hypothetical protein